MADEKNRPKTPHHVILEDRSFLTVSGVSDNVDTGEVTIEGEIHTLVYTDDRPKKLFARLFQ